MSLNPSYYSLIFKASYLIVIIPTLLVVVTAVLSSKEMGGTLGQGLKKTTAGTVIHTILLMTYLLIEQGNRGILNENIVKAFFMTSGILGSILLITGYIQIYKITKSLKLFTV